ncbi:hypothetical protein AYO40_02345 [Planctomycetaceae bacterium SCGC AG-212-D15]|nr:hypothetical protein AYO40_02345 [Planctomycetaceae bacterium SCGC AG-212-D15]
MVIQQKTGLARIPEIVDYLRLSRATVYRLMDRGHLGYVKIGKARRLEWSEVFRFVETHTSSNNGGKMSSGENDQ